MSKSLSFHNPGTGKENEIVEEIKCIDLHKSYVVVIQMIISEFWFKYEDDYEYEIFSIPSIAHAWTSVILAEKRDSGRHSTTSLSKNVVVAGTGYQIFEV